MPRFVSRPLRAAAVAVLLAASASGCGSSRQPGLVVFAASSLTRAFTDLGAVIQSENPPTAVEFTFAGSADLLAQLTGGAGADVLATADTVTMDRAARAGLLAGEPVVFAANTLTVVVAPGNPERITGFADLTRPDLAVVVCAPQVPCGAATVKLQDATGVRLAPVSEESAVGDVLAKVTTGQADAGVIYTTDARSAGGNITEVPVPAASSVVNAYPIAVLTQARDPGAARRFVDLVTGDAGQRILRAAGFAQP
ncbi:MAG TPA: molybdate ABC transporter substrate-binding protein [Mycobacterium sp.]|nr:MAG: molybdate ABC transporter substrate-binding protein [Mycobacterium sp.]HOB48868.1 molybdate ABC transporter substrate-binding protein [Mycobacterium sp.]HPZ95080.1 molybdate ABC transporter substrate-binding protein [Mycobacterium sp.]HQE14336.1 molybdate ABC transporter substrate-binding protein [Mycobacterium sp.]